MTSDPANFTHEVLHENDDTGSITVRVSGDISEGRFRVWPDMNQVKPELNDEAKNPDDFTWKAREYVRDEFVPLENREIN